jgi:exodeoxyribonuclease X
MAFSLLRVCDIETTGMTAPDAAPCEVGWVDLKLADPSTGLYVIDEDGRQKTLCNPSRPIPPEVSAIHHITDEDVAGAPFWPQALADCAAKDDPLFSPDVFVAHNAKFERQWFTEEVTGGKPWIDTYKCALRLWPEAPAHNNQALRYWLRPQGLNREIASGAHRAMPDAYVTAFLLREMLDKASVEDLIRCSERPALLPKVQFGKHFGKKWSEVDTGYLDWCLTQKDMDEDVKFTVRTELKRRGLSG